MDLKYFKNQGDGVFEINIKGIVGETIDGDEIANEIKFLNQKDAKVIRERINSVGGGIINGFSIISENLNSKAEIHTFNDGMAGSIASLILATGTPGKRSGFDFSISVIHDPSFDGKSLEDIEDEKERADTRKFKESLVQIYSNNTKLTKAQARKMMNEDLLLNAEEQLKIGLIDQIIPSKMKPIITKNMSYADIMNVCGEKDKFQDVTNKDLDPDNNNQITKKMSNEKLTKFYNLTDDASVDSILTEAQKDRSKAGLFENKVKALEKLGGEKDTEITNLKEDVKKYKNEAEKHQNEAIDVAVDSYIEAGVYIAENKDDLVANAKKLGLDEFNKLSKSITPKAVNVLNKVENKDTKEGAEKKSKEQKLADEYQNLITTDKVEIKRIKAEEPERFEKMFNAWNK